MDISSAIVAGAMEMKSAQFAVQYSTGVMAMEMDAMEDISDILVQQMMNLDVGSGTNQIDIMA